MQKPPFVTVEREFLSLLTVEEVLVHIIRAHLLQISTVPP